MKHSYTHNRETYTHIHIVGKHTDIVSNDIFEINENEWYIWNDYQRIWNEYWYLCILNLGCISERVRDKERKRKKNIISDIMKKN